MTEIGLTGLSRETFPLGILTALGALCAASSQSKHTAPTMRWTGMPMLSFPGGADELVQAVLEHATTLRNGFFDRLFDRTADVHADIRNGNAKKKVPVKHNDLDASLVDALRPMLRDPSSQWMLDIAAGLSSTSVIRKNDSDRIAVTSFRMVSGNQKLIESICNVLRHLDEDAVKSALFGPWRYDDGVHHLGLDSSMVRLGPFTGVPPTDEESRCAPGAVWLGVVSWQLFPCVPGIRRNETVGWSYGNGDELFLPVWEQPRNLRQVKWLLSHRADRSAEWYKTSKINAGGPQGNYRALSVAVEVGNK